MSATRFVGLALVFVEIVIGLVATAMVLAVFALRLIIVRDSDEPGTSQG